MSEPISGANFRMDPAFRYRANMPASDFFLASSARGGFGTDVIRSSRSA